MTDKAHEREALLLKELTPDPNVGEVVQYNCLGTLFLYDQQKQEKIGNGILQILKNAKTFRSRLLVRDANDLNKPLLNCYILPFGELKRASDKQYQFDAIDYAETVSKKTYIVKLIDDKAGLAFKDKYMLALSTNAQLLKNSKL